MCQSPLIIRSARTSTFIWNGLGKFIVICVFALCGSCAQVGIKVSQPEVRFEPIESWLDEHVESFEYNDMPISVLIGHISYHIPICFEGVEFREDQVKWIRDQRGHVTNVIMYPPKYNVSFQNISYRTLIDEVIGLDNTLQWKITSNGVINVLPRGDKDNEYSNSILNSIIPELDVENVELLHLLSGHPCNYPQNLDSRIRCILDWQIVDYLCNNMGQKRLNKKGVFTPCAAENGTIVASKQKWRLRR